MRYRSLWFWRVWYAKWMQTEPQFIILFVNTLFCQVKIHLSGTILKCMCVLFFVISFLKCAEKEINGQWLSILTEIYCLGNRGIALVLISSKPMITIWRIIFVLSSVVLVKENDFFAPKRRRNFKLFKTTISSLRCRNKI